MAVKTKEEEEVKAANAPMTIQEMVNRQEELYKEFNPAKINKNIIINASHRTIYYPDQNCKPIRLIVGQREDNDTVKMLLDEGIQGLVYAHKLTEDHLYQLEAKRYTKMNKKIPEKIAKKIEKK